MSRQELPPIISYAAPTPRRTNWHAVLSLFFGLMLFLPLIAGWLAIVYGRRGLHEARGHALGRVRIARAGIVLGVVNIAIGMILLAASPFAVLHAVHNARQRTCMANLRLLGQAILLYSNDNRGAHPTTLDLLVKSGQLPAGSSAFTCPECAGNSGKKPGTVGAMVSSYLAPAPPWKPDVPLRYIGTYPAELVVAWEPLSNHDGRGMNVLFIHGRVQWFGRPEAAQISADLAAGLNPPPSLVRGFRPAPPTASRAGAATR